MKREKEERSRSTASSMAGTGSLRRTWTVLISFILERLDMVVAYSDVEDLHDGGVLSGGVL